jgi:hypothetical protein
MGIMRVKDLIKALSKENQEAIVFTGFQEDYGILYSGDICRGSTISCEETPYSKGCTMLEMTPDNMANDPWVAILS